MISSMAAAEDSGRGGALGVTMGWESERQRRIPTSEAVLWAAEALESAEAEANPFGLCLVVSFCLDDD